MLQKKFVQKIKTFYVKCFSDNCAVYEIMWKSAVERRNNFACWMP